MRTMFLRKNISVPAAFNSSATKQIAPLTPSKNRLAFRGKSKPKPGLLLSGFFELTLDRGKLESSLFLSPQSKKQERVLPRQPERFLRGAALSAKADKNGVKRPRQRERSHSVRVAERNSIFGS